MPSGKKVDQDTKSKVVEMYYVGDQTVAEIAYQMGVKPRTVYSWANKFGHGRRFKIVKEPRKVLKLSHKEVEAILLMILECENIIGEEYFYTLKVLERRLLDAADELTEMEEV
ncbi:MAG: hypothetical protein J6S14_12005 [Clostridia bacterium]|nr:hypothetical protein [Clostridia bacterium]